MMATNCVRGFPELITIEDDDDEVEIYPPSSSAEAQTLRLFPRMSSWVPVVSEEDLELRLGLKAYDEVSSDPGSRINVFDEGVGDNFWRYTKMKLGEQGSSSNRLVEMKLRCAICMDTMREETSTTCGHVFCKPCITSAIRVQKKCPTCREKLSMTSIHRIYLPAPTTS
eukprot:TRINITY_DN13986_c0_g2_i1.p1 TRINITY_DN13986_c0_g2~~TRINITY_DN13986_c0_g2_i1.p1  ORF type:complete len:169 (-),score=19.42 TRINITY_DN13986_c0_g2_i1:238-744(-)